MLVSAVIGGAFLLLALAIDELRNSENRANHSLEALVAANRLERLVIDIETTQRGFVMTGKPEFLQPWYQARADFDKQAPMLEQLAAMGDHGQGARALHITRAVHAYIRDYAIPLVNSARHDPSSARSVAVTAEGKQRVDVLRHKFDQFMALERHIFDAGHQRADDSAHQALVAAGVSIAGSIVLILFSGAFLVRSVVRPVRRAAAMAGRVASGDLSVRMPETGPAEVGHLERSFNAMTGALAESRDELRRIADEQAALRRVATLVARGVPPTEVFSAVAAETGHVLKAEYTAIARFEPDNTAVIVGSWEGPDAAGLAPPPDSRWPADEASVAGQVLQARRPAWGARDDADDQAPSVDSSIRSAVGSPIVVEDQIWGVIIAFWPTREPPSQDVEARLVAFTELVATAVANSESRAQLAASRARVVAAADETRRRIERDLHDGTQHRLISLALEMRAAEAQIPPDSKILAQQWSKAVQGLNEIVSDLHEISRGLHPAVLEKGGLGPALRALARRSSIPVDIQGQVQGRLPERVEVAAYYVVSEALTNAAKHSRASLVTVDIGFVDKTLRLTVKDDGIGGADPAHGSGLVGLRDRVEAIGGRLEIRSPRDGGTSVHVILPAPE